MDHATTGEASPDGGISPESHFIIGTPVGTIAVPQSLGLDHAEMLAQHAYEGTANFVHKIASSPEAQTFGRELKSASDAVTGLPSAVYHAAADPVSDEEAHEYGRKTIESEGPVGRVIDRSIVQPAEHAIEDYATGKVSLDDVLANLPEALGGAAGAVTTGEAVRRLSIKAAPLTDAGRAAAAELKDIRQAADRPELRYDKSASDDATTHRIQVSKAGKPAGHIEATEFAGKPKTWHVTDADLGSNAGKGIGTKAYTELAKQAQRQNATIVGGESTNPAVARIYEKLKSSGFNVTQENGRYIVKPKPVVSRPTTPVHDITQDWARYVATPQ